MERNYAAAFINRFYALRLCNDQSPYPQSSRVMEEVILNEETKEILMSVKTTSSFTALQIKRKNYSSAK